MTISPTILVFGIVRVHYERLNGAGSDMNAVSRFLNRENRVIRRKRDVFRDRRISRRNRFHDKTKTARNNKQRTVRRLEEDGPKKSFI